MSNQVAQLNNKPPLHVEVKHIGTSSLKQKSQGYTEFRQETWATSPINPNPPVADGDAILGWHKVDTTLVLSLFNVALPEPYTLENEQLEPQNSPIEKENHLSSHHLRVPAVNFPGCMFNRWPSFQYSCISQPHTKFHVALRRVRGLAETLNMSRKGVAAGNSQWVNIIHTTSKVLCNFSPFFLCVCVYHRPFTEVTTTLGGVDYRIYP